MVSIIRRAASCPHTYRLFQATTMQLPITHDHSEMPLSVCGRADCQLHPSPPQSSFPFSDAFYHRLYRFRLHLHLHLHEDHTVSHHHHLPHPSPRPTSPENIMPTPMSDSNCKELIEICKVILLQLSRYKVREEYLDFLIAEATARVPSEIINSMSVLHLTFFLEMTFRALSLSTGVWAADEPAKKKHRRKPKYIVTDQGSQFQTAYLAWCAKNRVATAPSGSMAPSPSSSASGSP